MKTLKGWKKSDLDLDKYLTEPCEIDEDLANYIGEVVPPNYCDQQFVQLGEADFEKDDVMYYSTVSMVNDRHFYLGDLPDFNKPETEVIEKYCDFCPNDF